MKNKKILSIVLAVTIFTAILVLDLLTKEFIISRLIPNVGDSVDVMPGFINFIYVKNTGAAWGVLSGSKAFLIIITIVILILFLVFYILRVRRVGNKSSVWLAICIGLISGGCIGNLVDRIAFGYVRDFINFQFISFPVFNFADVALTCGMIVMLVYFIFFYAKEEKNANKSNEDKNEG